MPSLAITEQLANIAKRNIRNLPISPWSIFPQLAAALRRGRARPIKAGRTYKVFCKEYDREVPASQLAEVLGPLGEAYASTEQETRQAFSEDLLEMRDKAQPIMAKALTKLEAMGRERLQKSVVAILIDHSGSMRGEKILAAAATCDLAVRALQMGGVATEVLGFTTLTWQGGQSREKWIAQCKPSNPGRLCDLLHIIYREADDPQLGVPDLAMICRHDLLKENIDGEAVEWALARLMKNSRSRKYLVVLSDGAPVDDSTIFANGRDEGFLPWHLESVLNEAKRVGKVDVLGIGLGYRPSQGYPHSREVGPAEDLISVALEQIVNLLQSPSSSITS